MTTSDHDSEKNQGGVHGGWGGGGGVLVWGGVLFLEGSRRRRRIRLDFGGEERQGRPFFQRASLMSSESGGGMGHCHGFEGKNYPASFEGQDEKTSPDGRQKGGGNRNTTFRWKVALCGGKTVLQTLMEKGSPPLTGDGKELAN